jgi:hypothetical protein
MKRVPEELSKPNGKVFIKPVTTNSLRLLFGGTRRL